MGVIFPIWNKKIFCNKNETHILVEATAIRKYMEFPFVHLPCTTVVPGDSVSGIPPWIKKKKFLFYNSKTQKLLYTARFVFLKWSLLWPAYK